MSCFLHAGVLKCTTGKSRIAHDLAEALSHMCLTIPPSKSYQHLTYHIACRGKMFGFVHLYSGQVTNFFPHPRNMTSASHAVIAAA